MADNYKHKGLRRQLVELLRSKGIKNENILNAIGTVPRHLFIEKAFEDWAYKDQAFPIDADQTISQPYTVAFQSELLDPQKGDIILEIGTGSGYQAAILLDLCKRLYTIERQKVLHDKTVQKLQKLGYGHIRTLLGDGYQGLKRAAPFDKILITAGATEIPELLWSQLKPGGIMVIPSGSGDTKTMWRILKNMDNSMSKTQHGLFKFVPMLKGINKS